MNGRDMRRRCERRESMCKSETKNVRGLDMGVGVGCVFENVATLWRGWICVPLPQHIQVIASKTQPPHAGPGRAYFDPSIFVGCTR